MRASYDFHTAFAFWFGCGITSVIEFDAKGVSLVTCAEMRLLRLPIVVLVVALALASQAGRFLVVDDPQKSDAIVTLAGETDDRPTRAIDLLRQGMAPRVFLDAEAGAQIYNEKLTEIAQQFVNTLPEAGHVSVCPIIGRSTEAETRDVARCLQELGAHRVLIVTSEYHTRRALMIFSHRLPQYQWSVAAARNSSYFGAAWWTKREWAKVVFDEWEKLIWWELVDRWRMTVPINPS
jgi:hypothetical protein